MGFRFDHYHHLAVEGHVLAAMFRQLEDRIVSEISDRIAAVDASVDGMISRVQADIAKLQDLVAAGATTPEVLAALDAIKAKIDGFAPATAPPTPATPAPETPTPAPTATT